MGQNGGDGPDRDRFGAPRAPLPAGLQYFAIETLDGQGIAPRRGTTTASVPFTSTVFAAETRYRAWLLHGPTLLVGSVEFTSGRNGRRFRIPAVVFGRSDPIDSDDDQLPDLGEFIVGTDPLDADSDDDGVPDGAEVLQGTDPRPNSMLLTQGVIAAVDTPGNAQDICAVNDLAAVADGVAGVVVFNVFNGLNPKIIASVPTSFPITRVACVGRRIIALGAAGVIIIDLADPPRTQIVAQLDALRLGGIPTAVATAGRTAFIGLRSGRIATVDVATGGVFDTVILDPTVRGIVDLTVDRNWLYIVNNRALFVSRIDRSALALVAQIPIGRQGVQRVFAANGVVWVTHISGVATFDVSDPQPVPGVNVVTGEFGWRDIACPGVIGFGAPHSLPLERWIGSSKPIPQVHRS